MDAFLYIKSIIRCHSPPFLFMFQFEKSIEMEDRTMTEKEDKEDKTVRQFVLYCHAALKYEKLNYYNERRRRLEREAHIRFPESCLAWRAAFLTHTMPDIFMSWDMRSASWTAIWHRRYGNCRTEAGRLSCCIISSV